jgi:hypothetical protein
MAPPAVGAREAATGRTDRFIEVGNDAAGVAAAKEANDASDVLFQRFDKPADVRYCGAPALARCGPALLRLPPRNGG